MRTRTQLLFLTLLLAASLLPRLPLLANSEAAFSSDEAVDALTLQHLLERGEVTAFNWDATYYGIVEGLLALPFIAVLGSSSALAYKLSAVAGFLALLVAVFLLGRALYGEAEGLAAAGLLAVFSPQLLFWSTLAAGGYCLVVAWGTLTLLCLHRVLRTPSVRWYAALGFCAGFGLYIYELYLTYFALLLLAAGLSLLRPPFLARVRNLAFAGLGFLLGAAPKLLMFWSSRGTKRPSYGLAGWQQVKSNVRLLAEDCIPALFGVNLEPETLEFYNGPGFGPASTVLGALLLLGYAAAWLWALVRVLRPGDGPRRMVERTVEALLVALLPVVALLFVLSPNPQNAGSNRYLLPWLSAVPVLAGAALVRLGRRHRAAAVLVVLAVALPAVQSTLWLRERGFLTPELEVDTVEEPLHELIAVLRSNGLEGGYADYWIAYTATFLADEKLIISPYRSWDRYPPYSRKLGRSHRVAWIFPIHSPDPHEASFLNQLASAGRPYRVLETEGYRIYVARDGKRLLPPSLPDPPVALAHPRVEFLSAQVPARVKAGTEITVPVEVVNRSDAFWSASGHPFLAGGYMVTASYRWLPPDGTLTSVEGKRSLLPGDVPVGGRLKMLVRVPAPAEPGRQILRLTLIQEGVAWFDMASGGHLDRPVEVVP